MRAARRAVTDERGLELGQVGGGHDVADPDGEAEVAQVARGQLGHARHAPAQGSAQWSVVSGQWSVVRVRVRVRVRVSMRYMHLVRIRVRVRVRVRGRGKGRVITARRPRSRRRVAGWRRGHSSGRRPAKPCP